MPNITKLFQKVSYIWVLVSYLDSTFLNLLKWCLWRIIISRVLSRPLWSSEPQQIQVLMPCNTRKSILWTSPELLHSGPSNNDVKRVQDVHVFYSAFLFSDEPLVDLICYQERWQTMLGLLSHPKLFCRSLLLWFQHN